MVPWLEDWFNRQLNMLDDILPNLVGPLIFLGLALAPLAMIYGCWQSLSRVWRRQERAACLLSLLELGLEQGRTPEQTFQSPAARRVSEMGPLFSGLVDQLRSGLRLGAALDAVPRLLPPAVREMIKVGEELGDLRRVLPACRTSLKSGTDHRHSVFNNLIVLLFVSPIGPALIWFMAVFVFPKLQAIAADMTEGGSAWSPVLFEASVLLAKFIAALWLILWLASWLRDPQSRLHRWLGPVPSGLIQRVNFLLPWRRKRMQRDFSAMLALLLDAGVPEERAVQLAANCAANLVISQRAARVITDLRQGVKLTDAVRWLEDRDGFRWRLCNAVEPHRVEPHRVEPHRVEPHRVEPHRVEPHRVEPLRVEPLRGFSAALAGWLDTLDAKAFQQEQMASQVITTGFVLLNGAMVGLIALGSFQLIVAIMEEAAW